jgi:hypothetical protein
MALGFLRRMVAPDIPSSNRRIGGTGKTMPSFFNRQQSQGRGAEPSTSFMSRLGQGINAGFGSQLGNRSRFGDMNYGQPSSMNQPSSMSGINQFPQMGAPEGVHRILPSNRFGLGTGFDRSPYSGFVRPNYGGGFQTQMGSPISMGGSLNPDFAQLMNRVRF